MVKIRIEDNSGKMLSELEDAEKRILTAIGMKAEGYAKKLCPVGTSESTGKKGSRGGSLRNSITHVLEAEAVAVGTNLPYGPYVELGTGPYFEAPPEWEQFDAPKGSGVGHGYVKPRPFLRPAIENHKEEYKQIAEREMKK